jgi:hypothetical protein
MALNTNQELKFKLFIIPHVDYCSTIFQHATSKETIINQLERSFSKSLFKITKIKIGNLTLKQQLEKLTDYNLLPLKLRFFTRISKFIFKQIKISKSALSKNFIENNTITRTYYLQPSFHRNQGKFSFRTIATKLLNDFIFVKLEADNLNLAENQTGQNFDDFVISIYERNVKNWSSL